MQILFAGVTDAMCALPNFSWQIGQWCIFFFTSEVDGLLSEVDELLSEMDGLLSEEDGLLSISGLGPSLLLRTLVMMSVTVVRW